MRTTHTRSGSAGVRRDVRTELDRRSRKQIARLTRINKALRAELVECKREGKCLSELAQYDSLTGLPNRRLFLELLAQTLARARRSGHQVALLFLDLDRFKLINDTFGHAVGDLVLKAVAVRLTGCLRTTDIVARLSGDEFTIILEDVASSGDVGHIARKIQESLAAPLILAGHEVFATASIGIALYPTDSADRDGLINCADTAMYSAKREGGVQYYSTELNAKASERLKLETDLRHALHREEFRLFYQPLVDVCTQAVVGVEALLRWQHPERGLLSPDTFIPLAEDTGLIIPIGEWVLRTACAQAKAWQEGGFPVQCMAVNVSRRQFQQGNLVETIERILRETGLEPRCLEIELTESLLIENEERTISMLNALRRMGIRVAIDDFGSEYSSFGYLRRLPITTLKIDQSFVRDIATKPADASIVKAIITMAHCLNLNVIAEGVETERQVEMLRRQACNELQGYYFSRPLPNDALTTSMIERTHLSAGNGAVVRLP